MADIVDTKTRSRMMRAIPAKDTKPEKLIRSALHRRGYRFRLHRKHLPGKPDITLPRFRAVILVHGCFWHRHGCRLTASPGSNNEFWSRKFEANVSRDARQRYALLDLGWRIGIIWECAIRDHGADEIVRRLEPWLHDGAQEISIP